MVLVYLSLTMILTFEFLVQKQRSSIYEMCKSEPWFAGYFPLMWENFLREKCQKCAYRGFMCSKAGKISADI